MNTTSPSYTVGDLKSGAYCCTPVAHLSIQHLSVSYGERTVLEDVSLDIYQGCITALIGPSGCGKSSFLMTLNRMTDLLTNARVKGEIHYNGQDIINSNIDVMALRRNIGLIFQKPNPFPLSIRRNLELPLREHGVTKKIVIDQKIEKALQEVGLWEEVKERLDSPALALSGGQQQRLCIARALILEPKILLMDEPCSALDPLSSAVVEELIMSLRGRYTVIIVTHNLAQARRIANYAAFFWMKERVGQLIEFGKCHRIFDEPHHEITAAYVSGAKG